MSAGKILDALEKPSPMAEVEWALERAEASPYPFAYWIRQARARRGIGLARQENGPKATFDK